MDVVRAAFSLDAGIPEDRRSRATVKNLMDTGIQLGRRFRALKLWMVLRHFGAEGIRERLAEHMRLARLFAEWVDASSDFERDGARPLQRRLFPRARHRRAQRGACSTVSMPRERFFFPIPELNGRYTLRLAIGNLHTTESHVARAWTLIQRLTAELRDGRSERPRGTSACSAFASIIGGVQC